MQELSSLLSQSSNLEILLLVLSGVIVLATIWIIRLEIKMRRLLRGSGARTLDDSIHHLDTALKKMEAGQEVLRADIDELTPSVEQSIRGVHTVRFNPFNRTGAGGNQSFATAFINEHGDGVVLSSLYTRERVSVYAKPVSHFTSEYDLTKEEKEAVEKANPRNNLK